MFLTFKKHCKFSVIADKDASPVPEGQDAQSSEAQPEKEGSTTGAATATGDEANEEQMTGVEEREGEGEGEKEKVEKTAEGEEEGREREGKNPVEETGEQSRLVRIIKVMLYNICIITVILLQYY